MRLSAAALVDHQALANIRRQLDAGCTARSVDQRSDMAVNSERQFADRIDAEPVRNFDRRKHADETRMLLAAVEQRQQQQFKIDLAVGDVAESAGHAASGFVGAGAHQALDIGAALRAPQLHERRALQLAAKQRTDARTGEAKLRIVAVDQTVRQA